MILYFWNPTNIVKLNLKTFCFQIISTKRRLQLSEAQFNLNFLLSIESVCWKQNFVLKKSTVFSLQLQKYYDTYEKRSSPWKFSPVSNRWRLLLAPSNPAEWLVFCIFCEWGHFPDPVLFDLGEPGCGVQAPTTDSHLSLTVLFQMILRHTKI